MLSLSVHSSFIYLYIGKNRRSSEHRGSRPRRSELCGPTVTADREAYIAGDVPSFFLPILAICK